MPSLANFFNVKIQEYRADYVKMIEFIVSFNQLPLYTTNSDKMQNDTVFSSMSFTILGLQVTFGVQAELLKMKVTPLGDLRPSQLALNRMSVEPSAI